MKLLDDNWISCGVPKALPVGQCHIDPPTTPHAVSSSLPTWNDVISWSRKEKAAKQHVDYSYPRFFIAKPIQTLITNIRHRLQITTDTISCMVFPSTYIAAYCAQSLRESKLEASVTTIRFFLPCDHTIDTESAKWTDFSVVLFPTELTKESMLVWMDTGAGITTRHADFCLKNFDLLESDSTVQSCGNPVPSRRSSGCRIPFELRESGLSDMQEIRERIAHLVTSEKMNLKKVKDKDVFIFPTGMNAIYATSEALAAFTPGSDVVAYGWLYPETVHVLKRSPWKRVVSFKWGTDEELDELERILTSPSQHITALFCEMPSNIKLISPNIHRIRLLAEKHGFIVVCDETTGNFVNLDILPYVDIVLSSLTKMFSGASNVTGGSVVINSNSRHYERIRYQLSIQYENVFCFPTDMAVLNSNSTNMARRVRTSNANTVPIVTLLNQHSSIAQVNHPSLGPTSSWYKSAMRPNGGYGNVLSVVFHDPDTARCFYDVLDVCKGSSFGTNFTLAIPYVQLACYWNQEQCEKYGLPRHIIRISVGLESCEEIVGKIASALRHVEKFEFEKKTLMDGFGSRVMLDSTEQT